MPDSSCRCGCGGVTTTPKHSDSSKGWVRGVPLPYIKGHHPKKRPATTVPPGRRPFWDDDLGCHVVRLTQGAFCKIDEVDVGMVSRSTWCLDSLGYAVARVEGELVRMHRAIVGPSGGEDVDHINGDKLDNRRANLRACSRRENARNRPGKNGGTSRFKGVSRDTQTGRWAGVIKGDERRVFLGYFDSEEEAAAAYDKAAVEHHKGFAWTNAENG